MRKIYLEIKCDGNVISKGYILDLSAEGVGIRCKKEICKGAVVEVVTENGILPRMKAEVVTLIVTERKDYIYRLGLKFISQSKETRKCLEAFIRSKEKREDRRVSLDE